MSVHGVTIVKLPSGRWEARVRMGGRGSRRPSKWFDRKGDAEKWGEQMLRRAQLGDVDLAAGRMPLDEFIETYWVLHAIPNLEASTRASYKRTWANHIKPRLGGYALRELTPKVITRYRAALTRAGAGDPTVLRAMAVLQSILTLAVTEGHLRSNPVVGVRKPAQTPARQRVPVPVATIEAIRVRLRARPRRLAQIGVRDAALVSLLAYAGLRPQEALALQFEDIGARSLSIAWKMVDGELVPWTKTREHRTVPLWPALAEDLREWRLASGRRRALLFARVDGGPWTETDYRNWRRRIYQPAARAEGLAGAIPYDLRATWVSLMLHDGHTILEVATAAGHSPETCVKHYARVLAEVDPARRVPAQEQIRCARADLALRTQRVDDGRGRPVDGSSESVGGKR